MKKLLSSKSFLLTLGLLMGGVNFANSQEEVTIDTSGYESVYSEDFTNEKTDYGWIQTSGSASATRTSIGGNNCMAIGGTYNRTLNFPGIYKRYDLEFKWFAKVKDATTGAQIKFVISNTSAKNSLATTKYQFRINNNNATNAIIANGVGTSVQDISSVYTYSTTAPASIDDFYTVRIVSDGSNVRISITKGESSVSYTTEFNSTDFMLGGLNLQNADGGTSYIDDIVLKVPTKNWTINYVYDETVKKTETGYAEEGETVSATLPIVVNDQRYFAATGATTSWTKGSSNVDEVFTVNLREASNFSWTAYAKYGETTLETIGSSSTTEGDKSYIVTKRYYNNNGTLLTTTAFGDKDYNVTIEPDEDGYVKNVSYTPTSINNVVFFSEAEDIETLTQITPNTYIVARYSGGLGAYANGEAKKITTLGAGKYKLTAHALASEAITFSFKAGSDTIWKKVLGSDSFYYGTGTTGEEFALDRSSDIMLQPGGYGGNASKIAKAVDFIYIQQTAEYAPIGSTGFATYCSTYDLDFSEAEGLTAWIAKRLQDGVIKMEPVAGVVKAGTGLVIRGTSGYVPIASTEGTDYSSTNKLIAVTSGSETVSKASSGTNYVLSVQGGNVVFAPIDGVSATVTAGHAYLHIPETSARILSMQFDDENITGVTELGGCQLSANRLDCYNLRGQRVAHPQKGLYIVDGRKVVLK